MDNRPAPLRWTHWIRFLLIPVCFFLLAGALVQQGPKRQRAFDAAGDTNVSPAVDFASPRSTNRQSRPFPAGTDLTRERRNHGQPSENHPGSLVR